MTEVNRDLGFGPARHETSTQLVYSRNHDLVAKKEAPFARQPCPVCYAQSYNASQESLSICPNCNHIFQSDLNVTTLYDAAYAHQYDSRPVLEMSQIRWEFIQSVLGLRRGSRVLDIGYGNGAFLKHVKSQGMEIFGADIHHEDFGIPEVTLATKLRFDLICLFDSLEHFADFEPILRLQANYVIVSVPNVPASFLERPREWRHYKPGEHLHYFSRQSLNKLMCRWGFGIRPREGHPEDSIRGRVSIAGDFFDNIYTAIYSKR